MSNSLSKKITVIGSGVVGQATGKGFSAKGFDVEFVDVDTGKVDQLKKEGYSAFTADEIAERNYDSDISIFTVPTPTVNGKIKFDYLEQASIDLGKRLAKVKKYHILVTRSTILPGTTRDLVIPLVEKHSGKKCGVDFGACMNPEYLREETAVTDFSNPWLVVIGQFDQKSGDLLEEVYKKFECPIERVALEEAEIQKYIHNLFNATKIAFFNEFRHICQNINVDANNIFNLVAKSCEGMWNTKYGIRDRGPFSGSCLPKDTQAMYAWATEKGYDVDVLEATIKANEKFKTKHKK